MRGVWLALASLLALVAVGSGGRVECVDKELDARDPENYCSMMAMKGKLKAGTLCLIRPEQVHPTQFALGKAAMHCHRRQLESMSQRKLLKYKMDNQVPTFVGPPNNTFYIADKHHMSTALFEAELLSEDHMLDRAMFACIQDDLGHLEVGAFWKHMNSTGNCYLFDQYGKRIEPSHIPKTLKKLRDDPFRTLSRYLRTSRGFVKCGGKKTRHLPLCQKGSAPFFIEFTWADYLRNVLPPIRDTSRPQIRPHSENYIYEVNFQSQIDALRAVLPLAVSVAMSDVSRDLPGFNDYPDLFRPSLADIDEYGCDNDTSQ